MSGKEWLLYEHQKSIILKKLYLFRKINVKTFFFTAKNDELLLTKVECVAFSSGKRMKFTANAL